MISSAGSTPVTEAAPAGSAVREDPRFSDMQREMDALTSISAEHREPDWPKVVSLGADLLTGLGKDIMVAAWLGGALLRTEGAQGILTGAAILADMCSLYWQEMFPPVKRLRARIAAIDWWQEQVENWLERGKPESLPEALLQGSMEQIRRLEDAVNKAAPDNELRLHSLLSKLNRIPAEQTTAQTPSAAQPEPPATPADASSAARSEPSSSPVPKARPAQVQPAQASTPAPATSPVPPAPGIEADSPQFTASCSRFCLEAANALLSLDLSNPAPYVLRRTAIWAFLRQEPPSESGRTRLPSPADHILPGLRALLSAGEYEKALRGAESHVSAHVYWLDLSALAAAALAALGAEYQAARNALEGEIAGLMHRLPGLADMTFEDGLPFANAETRQWLAGFSGGQGPTDPFALELAEARNRKPAEALESLGDMLLRHAGGRQALEIYAAVLDVCGKGELWGPVPYTSARLLELVQRHALTAYDPPAAAKALSASVSILAQALRAEPENARLREQYALNCAELAGLQPHALLG